MVEPFCVFLQSAFEALRELPEMINELSVQVLNASFDLALVLRIRRMRKMSLNTVPTAPVLPLPLELATVVGKDSFWKLFLLFYWLWPQPSSIHDQTVQRKR